MNGSNAMPAVAGLDVLVMTLASCSGPTDAPSSGENECGSGETFVKAAMSRMLS